MRFAPLLLLLLACREPGPTQPVKLPVASAEVLEEWTSVVRSMRMDMIDSAGKKLKERVPVQEYRSSSGPTVIALWATYCPPCLEEMPMFEALHDDGHRILGISMDSENFEDVAKVLDKHGPSYPQGVLQTWSMKKVGQFLKTGLPFTIVLDRKGNVRYLFSGKANEAALRAALGRLQS